MTATQDLIAASLTLADMDERVAEMPTQAAADVREMCARAMVQPDVSEVERLVRDYGNACRSDAVDVIATGDDPESCGAAHAALLDAVRAIVAERNHAVDCADAYKSEADHFRDATKMAPEGPTPSMLDAAERIDWSDSDVRANCVKMWHVMFAAAYPVGEVPMPEVECDLPPLGWRCTRANGHEGPCAAVECQEDIALVERGMKRLREVPMPDGNTSADPSYTAGYAAGVTSGAKQMFDALQFAAANTTDTEWDERLCEYSESALESVSPEAHAEWKTIQRVAKESHQQGYAAGVVAAGRDAERYSFLRRGFSPFSLNIDGNHSWAYRRNATLKGPNLDDAIDAALRGEVKP